MKLVCVLCAAALLFTGCFQTQLKLFRNGSDPLNEVTLDYKGKDKIAVIPVNGMISDQPRDSFMQSLPSVVQEAVSQLKIAELDPQVKAVVLKVDSPGGTAVASDLLYHEILEFKKRSGKKVVVSIQNMGTSGAYYISLPADKIYAHPLSVVGSVGVILMRPKVHGLMEKIGVSVEVSKSGSAKDEGSPFNPATPEERAYFQHITDSMGALFLNLVKKHRALTEESVKSVATAAVYLPEEAMKLGLIDGTAYLEEALGHAAKLAGIKDPSIVVYRRDFYANDNLYNDVTAQSQQGILQMKIPFANALDAGFYYLCPFFGSNN